MPDKTVKDVVEERGEKYGISWWVHGEIVKILLPQIIDLINVAPKYFFAWTLILNKLLRILTSPFEEDHWLDIQGYAELPLQDIRRRKE